MKHYLRLCIIVLMSFFSTTSLFAYDFEVNGIYYNILSRTDWTCEVTRKESGSSSYSGEIIIPSTITYSGKTFKVTTIGEYAFFGADITSIVIPNGIQYIKVKAFEGCM